MSSVFQTDCFIGLEDCCTQNCLSLCWLCAAHFVSQKIIDITPYYKYFNRKHPNYSTTCWTITTGFIQPFVCPCLKFVRDVYELVFHLHGLSKVGQAWMLLLVLRKTKAMTISVCVWVCVWVWWVTWQSLLSSRARSMMKSWDSSSGSFFSCFTFLRDSCAEPEAQNRRGPERHTYQAVPYVCVRDACLCFV